MSKFSLTFIVFTLVLIISGCDESTPPQAQKRPLQPIDVAEVLYKPVQSWHTYTTRLESPEKVVLMPRVSGVINHIAFKEGEKVAKGDLLFQLDDRPYVAIVSSLEAQLVSAKAAFEQAESESKRAVKLAERKAIPVEEVELRKSTLRQREAELAVLKAQIEAATLNVEYAAVRSPIDGVISRANITRGNNVIAGQSELTSIISDQKIYAYFDIDERTWNQSFDDIVAQSKQPVIMQKVGQVSFNYNGYINFIDHSINASTGTLRVRAVFDNDEHKLRAGSFARIKVATNAISNQVIIPDRAIGTDLKNNFALVVGENNVLQYKLITLGQRYGKLRAITSGLAKGDVIAVNGPARVGPGMPVAPNTVVINSEDLVFIPKIDTTTNLLAKG